MGITRKMVNEIVAEIEPPYTITLEEIDNSTHKYAKPLKKIEDGEDVTFFKRSKAYSDVVSFILLLNVSMFPKYINTEEGSELHSWELGSEAVYSSSSTVVSLRAVLKRLRDYISEVPPDTGPRRFGNISFRKWFGTVRDQSSKLLEENLPDICKGSAQGGNCITATDELISYFMGSFGSAERLDYGTGHELNFIAFLAGIWKLRGFRKSSHGEEERAIVIGVFEPYLQLIRELIITYTLEPAGSHGVWGLDDHFFLPYLFGSAQLSAAIDARGQIPTEGSLPGSPAPTEIIKPAVVHREGKRNMYFSAIGFIYDVKKGPFWEHSPILYDISGVRAGWAKINKGMIKMYLAEVLSKFPVVQHFLFGSLFSWELHPDSEGAMKTIHTSNQPGRDLSITNPDAKLRRQLNININIAGSSQNNKTNAAGFSQLPTALQPVSSQSPNVSLTRAPWANAANQAALPDQSNFAAHNNSKQQLRHPGARR